MVSGSKRQTQRFAAKLARRLRRQMTNDKWRIAKNKATIIALCGELGSGKTTFTQGFIKAFGVKHHITSPTFIIYRKHEIPKKSISHSLYAIRWLYHFDLYRIQKPKEILKLGFKKIIDDSNNIVLIEWPEKIKKILPKNTIWIYFGHGKNCHQRHIKIGC